MSETLLAARYKQLLGYIAELDRLRTETVRTVDEHPDKLDLSSRPSHASVEWNPVDQAEFLVVTRCSPPESPRLPDALKAWVHYEPNQTEVEPTTRERAFYEGQEVNWEERGPTDQWESWIMTWKSWAVEAQPAFAAKDLYTRLYDLHAILERSSDQLELVAADVAVALRDIDHPILINPVRIELDVERSRITVGCQDESAQVYGDAIRGSRPEVGDSIAKARKEVGEIPDIWAFGGDEVDLFAKRFVQGADPDGEFIVGERPRERLTARRSPWLLLRRRATGLAELAEGLRAKFEQDGEIPAPIQPILLDRNEPVLAETGFRGEPDEDEQSYFTKPANAEQLAILRNFRRSRSVHVQGPPGTGKTHTIANLIGHFLAEGKSVLVTSEKAQALSVLREKVVDELRPLCVSLVGSDAGEGLKAGMRGLNEKLGSSEPGQLQSEVEKLTSARARTIKELHEARQTIREIIEREHQPIEVRGWRDAPSAAGRYLHEKQATLGWIPGDVDADSGPPLTQKEFNELLDLLVQFSGEVVPEVRKRLPLTTDVPSPQDYRSLLDELERLRDSEPAKPAIVFADIQIFNGGSEAAAIILRDTDASLQKFANLDPSYRELANRAIETPALVKMWESWAQRATSLLETEQQVTAEAAPYEFTVSGQPQQVLESAKQLLGHVQKSGRAVSKPRIFNRQDKLLYESVRSRRALGDETSLKALINKLEFEDKRDRFRAEVRAAAASSGLTALESGDSERQLGRDSSLQVALRWALDSYHPIVNQLTGVGLGSDIAEAQSPVHLSGSGPADRMAWWLKEVVRPVLVRYVHRQELDGTSKRLQTIKSRAEQWIGESPSKPLKALAAAVLAGDVSSYGAAYEDVAELRAAAEPVHQRDYLLAKLGACAESFAASLEDGSFQMGTIQGTLEEAWTFAQIDQELRRRTSLSLEQTKEKLDRLKGQLDNITIRLASARAWAAQHKRATQPVRSALSRFHDAQRKIGGGQGKRVPEYHRVMRNAMRDAKDAFRVWIMPLHELSKSFDFTNTRFDVVIVDESSQLSAVGLITLLIADSAIIVGDDEQTEPSLTGVPLDSVKALINEHLPDFTDQVLWSPDSSLYSFAGRFGATVGLREHFRCVPQIISFSSKLCYQGKIQALRDASGVVQLPHVVTVPCISITNDGVPKNVNEAEAQEIASLVIACYELPEYQGQSFGVISLPGSSDKRGEDVQTSRISSLIRNALGAPEFERFAARTKFKTGVPPAFQGDERDVVFISVGDDPANLTGGRSGPIRMRGEETTEGARYRKRLNVAVSRARNQVWIVHCFAHFEAELKEGDIRRKLLEFAYAPDQWLESVRAVNPKAESPFEQAVYADLVRLGFAVTSQVPVGHYRIDLVAEGADARVAIECDGDAYHQDAAADIARQIVLERCGWKFVRVRGSEYYRDPERAVKRIMQELAKLGVTPAQNQPPQTEPQGALLQRVRSRAQEIREYIRAEKPINLRYESDAERLASVPVAPLPQPALLDTFEECDELFFLPVPDQVQAGGAVDDDELTSQAGESLICIAHGTDKASGVDDHEYVVFSETGFADPKNLATDTILLALTRIVRVEGPATEATIVDRYRVATGYGRFKGPTRDRVLSALRTGVDRGMLNSQPDYPGSDVIIYSLPGEPDVRVRSRGPRDFDDVPMAEIVLVASKIIRDRKPFDDEETYRHILDFFALKRMTAQAKERLRIACELAVTEIGARQE